MIIGGMIWAYVIGECCGAVANLDPLQTAFQHNMDALNFMLADQGVPDKMRKDLRAYFRESRYVARLREYSLLRGQMSRALRGQYALMTIGGLLEKVWYFWNTGEAFLADVADKMSPVMFNTRERIQS